MGIMSPPSELASLRIPLAVQISEADASTDLAALANEIEKRLDLLGAQAMSFSEVLLTKEGMQKSHPSFQDFEERGQRIAYLIVNPATPEVFEPKKTDIMLHFEPMDDEMTAIFGDIVGADLTQRTGTTLTESEAEKIARKFPILWKISEYYEDAYLNPREAETLLRECVALDETVSSPKALRGLDKVSRIARWAAENRYGVLFEAP